MKIFNLTFFSRHSRSMSWQDREDLCILQQEDRFPRNKDIAGTLDKQGKRIALFLFLFAHPLPNDPM